MADLIKVLRRLAVAAENADPEARPELGAELRAACLAPDALAALAGYFAITEEETARAIEAVTDDELPGKLRGTIDADRFKDRARNAAADRKLAGAQEAAEALAADAARLGRDAWALDARLLAETFAALPAAASFAFALPDGDGTLALDVRRVKALLAELKRQRVAVYAALERNHAAARVVTHETGRNRWGSPKHEHREETVTHPGWCLVIEWVRSPSPRRGQVRLFGQANQRAEVIAALRGAANDVAAE